MVHAKARPWAGILAQRPWGSRAGVLTYSCEAAEHRLARVSIRRHKHWGWGFEDQQPTPGELREAAAGLAAHLGLREVEVEDPVPLDAVKLAPAAHGGAARAGWLLLR